MQTTVVSSTASRDGSATTVVRVLRSRYDPSMGTSTASLESRFHIFHRENPRVFRALALLALRWCRKSSKPCSIAMLFEIIRYQSEMKTTGDVFKLNNSYRSRYARLLEQTYPQVNGRFVTRQLTS